MNRRFNLADNEEAGGDPPPRMGAGLFLLLMLAFPIQFYLTDNHGGK